MYTIGDFLIRIKNAYMAGKREVTFSYSRVVFSIGKLLEEEGYIKKIKTHEKDNKKIIQVELLYKNKQKALQDVKLISKPSVHMYVDKNNIPKAGGGFGITIVSTNRGIMTDKRARKEKVGGEIICQIF